MMEKIDFEIAQINSNLGHKESTDPIKRRRINQRRERELNKYNLKRQNLISAITVINAIFKELANTETVSLKYKDTFRKLGLPINPSKYNVLSYCREVLKPLDYKVRANWKSDCFTVKSS